MKRCPVLRQLLMDKLSLKDYQEGKTVLWKDIRRRMILCERNLNLYIPDHFYHAAADNILENSPINSLDKLMSEGFYLLASKHLEWKENLLYVQSEAYNDWQDLLTLCSPLVLISSILAKDRPIENYQDISSCGEYISRYITSNASFTALKVPFIPYLECKKKEHGFNDLHLHINGSMEADSVWLNSLKEPMKLYQKVQNKENTSLVKEQFEQEDIFKDAYDFYKMLLQAKALRYYIINQFILPPNEKKEFKYPYTDLIINSYNLQISQNIHPLWERLQHGIENKQKFTDMEVETLMYVSIITLLRNTDYQYKSDLSQAFHHYLLIQASVNRFIVQQLHQKGFQQFQKITKNDLRRNIEEKIVERFFQFNGNSLERNFIHTVEGRFAPGDKSVINYNYIQKINEAWNSFSERLTSEKKPELYLIAHFIKEKDNNNSSLCYRHQKLRNSLWKKAHALQSVCHDYSLNVTGIDAASSEFDAPPEVFAPTYRFLRNNGIKHSTFHAGEDFYHIISGLRAIYESILFLDLKSGDRIGHAVALGVSPDLWYDRIGGYVSISQGEWLDNLIFTHYFIKELCYDNVELASLLPRIESEINQLCFNIYKKNYSIYELTMSWLCRKWCPGLFLCEDYEQAQKANFDYDEWNLMSQEIKDLSPTIKEIARRYHDIDYKKAYDRKFNLQMNKDDFFLIENLKKIQNELLKFVAKKGIALETLPTSNVRIGIYKNYKEHHLWRWLGIDNERLTNYPPIVVGSDDTGIFATNIYNEYAHIYNTLQQDLNYNNPDQIIEKLHKNSLIFTFK